MKFLWATIIVNDMEESVKFYQEVVGLKVVDKVSAGPVQPNSSLKYFIIHDPNGLKIQFAEHMK